MDRLHPTEAEGAVLGGIIQVNERIDKLTLTEDDFHLPKHRWTFMAMQALREEGAPIDVLTIENYLSKQPTFRLDSTELEAVGGFSWLAQLDLRCPSSDNVHAYAEIVREASTLRRLLKLGASIHDRIAAGADLGVVRGLLQEADGILGAPVQGEEPSSLANLGLGKCTGGLPCRIGDKLPVPGGIPKGMITTIYADTGHGKTTFKNSLLFDFARAGRRCLDVSLEDSPHLTVARFLAQKHNLSYGKIATGVIVPPPLDDADKAVLSNIVDGSGITPRMKAIIHEAERLEVEAVFVDYVQLLEGCAGDHAELAESMRLAQLGAAKLGVAFVLTSQIKPEVRVRGLSRDNRGRPTGSPRPGIRDTIGSSTIANATKLGLGLFRPVLYCAALSSEVGPLGDYCKWQNNHENLEEACEIYPDLAEVIVGKAVLGPAGEEVRSVFRVDWSTGAIEPFTL